MTTVYTITTSIKDWGSDIRSDIRAYAETFISKDAADGYYEAETGYYKDGVRECYIDEYVPEEDRLDGLVKSVKIWLEPGVQIEVTYKKHEE